MHKQLLQKLYSFCTRAHKSANKQPKYVCQVFLYVIAMRFDVSFLSCKLMMHNILCKNFRVLVAMFGQFLTEHDLECMKPRAWVNNIVRVLTANFVANMYTKNVLCNMP